MLKVGSKVTWFAFWCSRYSIHSLRAGLVGLVPDAGDVAEAILLVVVVVADRILLDRLVLQERFHVAVVVRHGVEVRVAGDAGVEVRDAVLRQVGDGAHLVLVRFVDRRGVDLRRLVAAVEELDAVDVVGRGPAHPFARLLGRRHRPVRPARAERLVVEDARRDDLVLRRAVLLGAAQRRRRQRHAADRGDAVREPQLVGVAQVRRLVLAGAVHVHVDEAGHHVHALAVDLEVGVARLAIGLLRQPRPAGLAHRGDPVALDDDVHRAERRTAGAVDQGDAADHHLLERPGAVARLARGRGAVAGVAAAALARRLGRRRLRGGLRERGLAVDGRQGESRDRGGGIECCFWAHGIPAAVLRRTVNCNAELARVLQRSPRFSASLGPA